MINWNTCPECRSGNYVVVRNSNKGHMIASCETCRVEWDLPGYRKVEHPKAKEELHRQLEGLQRAINQQHNVNEDYR